MEMNGSKFKLEDLEHENRRFLDPDISSVGKAFYLNHFENFITLDFRCRFALFLKFIFSVGKPVGTHQKGGHLYKVDSGCLSTQHSGKITFLKHVFKSLKRVKLSLVKAL